MTTRDALIALMGEFRHQLTNEDVPDDMEVLAVGPLACVITRNSVRTFGDRADYPNTSFFTREPITPPRPPLPTEWGALILDVTTVDGIKYNVAIRGGVRSVPWHAPNRNGTTRCLTDNEIKSFTLARVLPNGVGVMDEDDKRDVWDNLGVQWFWVGPVECWQSSAGRRFGTKAAICRVRNVTLSHEKPGVES